MISQLTRHSQLVTIPQAALLTTSNVNNQGPSHVIHNLQPASVYRNATLRSTRSVPAIVYHQRQQLMQQHQQQQQQQQKMLYNQNANNFDNLDSCPVHGTTNAINSLAATNHSNNHHHQMLPAQLANGRPPLNIRKFASVNDLSSRSAAVNYIQTANSQLMPTVFLANHNLQPAIHRSMKANPTITSALSTAQLNEQPKLTMTNLLPLPMHPAVATPTIYTQPISIARQAAPVLIPTFTTEPNSYAIAKHNKEQLINIIEANQDACCKGHLIVLWIILSVVVVGVVSGIILGLTI